MSASSRLASSWTQGLPPWGLDCVDWRMAEGLPGSHLGGNREEAGTKLQKGLNGGTVEGMNWAPTVVP